MAQGAVKWFNDSKGFGFIAADDGEEIYVDHKAIRDPRKSLKEGDRVEFELQPGARGARAINVRTAGARANR
jgi:CspA family cold shock protein